MFGLVQGEPRKDDLVITVEDMNFAIEDYYEEVFKSFDVDYYNGMLRKGFTVYPNGQRGGC